jgi:hypothetical protein
MVCDIVGEGVWTEDDGLKDFLIARSGSGVRWVGMINCRWLQECEDSLEHGRFGAAGWVRWAERLPVRVRKSARTRKRMI